MEKGDRIIKQQWRESNIRCPKCNDYTIEKLVENGRIVGKRCECGYLEINHKGRKKQNYSQ
jgi:formylmethanofuran dehydrogenase subunit E